MRVEKHPPDYPVKDIFPNIQPLVLREGGAIYTAEKEGRYYLILNESGMADFLLPGEDDDLLAQLIKVYEFESAENRDAYIRERGWKH